MKRIWESIEDIVRRVGIALQPLILLLIRLYWGYEFTRTGVGKFQHFSRIISYFHSLDIPWPHFFATLTAITEFSGGICFFLGMYARLSASSLFCILFVAYLTAERPVLSALFTQFDTAAFFASTPFLFTYAVIFIFCFGPGKYSIDFLLRHKKA